MSKVKKIGDLGTPERHARKELTVETINDTKVARVRHKLSYQLLHKRKTITDVQYYASERLYDTYLRSQPTHNCEYREQVDGGKRDPLNERIINAQQEFNNALKQLESNEKTCVIYVIINDNSLTKESMNSRQKKQRRELICSALQKLAKHYKYV